MWLNALYEVFSLTTLTYIVFGVVIGIVVGALPGLGPVFALAIFLPLTFGMDAANSLVFLSALYCSTVYGGSITAILINSPGTTGSIATCFDGFPMTRKGEGGLALGAALGASFFATVCGGLFLAYMGPLLGRFALKLGPAEYFMLSFAALSLVAATSKGNTRKGLFMGAIGLMISYIGRDVMTATERFTFGSLYIMEGIPFVPFVIGLFAFSQALYLADESGTIAKLEKATDTFKGVIKVFTYPVTLVKSTLIGLFVGILPGVGINVANFLAYTMEKRSAKDWETFGKGNIKGVIAPEAANNGSVYASLIPAFALGIPGSSTAAIFLGALMIHGLTPGPGFFSNSTLIFPMLIVGIIVSAVVFLLFGLIGNRYFVKVTQIPNSILVAMIVLLSAIGAFSVRNLVFDVLVMIISGVLGYIWMKKNYPLACLVLGVILGPMVEANFHRALRISDGSYLTFITRPISAVLFVLVVYIILSSIFTFPSFSEIFNKGKNILTKGR